MPDVLARLGEVARRLGRMPGQRLQTAAVYEHLTAALDQVGCLDDIC